MNIPATFPDVLAGAISVLSDALSARSEPYVQGVSVRSKAPADSSDVPVVQLGKDSDRVTYPIISRSTLRVTVWHSTEGNAADLASLCQGLILSHSGEVIEATTSLTGPIPGVDPNSGLDFATFTVAAITHATVL